MIVIMAGLPGTGKSTIARELALLLPGTALDKDAVRAALFPPSAIEYSTQQDDFCMHVLAEVASYLLERDPNRHVIVDGRPFSRRYQVEEWRALAASRDVPLAVIECRCAPEEAKRRLEADRAAGCHPAQDRDYARYVALRAAFEPIEPPKLVVHTDGSLQSCVDSVLRYLQAI